AVRIVTCPAATRHRQKPSALPRINLDHRIKAAAAGVDRDQPANGWGKAKPHSATKVGLTHWQWVAAVGRIGRAHYKRYARLENNGAAALVIGQRRLEI